MRLLVRYPFQALLNLPRIWRHALILILKHHLPIQQKMHDKKVLRVNDYQPTFIQRTIMTHWLKMLQNLKYAQLKIVLPNGENYNLGNTTLDRKVTLNIHDYRLFSRVALFRDIGFGESYMDGDWDCDNLPLLLSVLSENIEGNTVTFGFFSFLTNWINKGNHLLHKNSMKQSAKNIDAHYNLSNDMFSLFLDRTMTYSSAIFESPNDSLEVAQKNKIHTIIKKAHITKDDHVLEIGCGWGGFAIEAVKRTGCRVTGLTISAEQKKYAEVRIEEEGLSDRISILFADYRTMEGTFDKIISIEMIEAVGDEYLTLYLRSIDRLLAKNGIAVIQGIFIPDQRYKAYIKEVDWLKKHIFPGGHLPSLETIVCRLSAHTSLSIEDVENIGPHYAMTLAKWRSLFLDRLEDVRNLGFSDVFIRKWDYYFASCEAAFKQRFLMDYQLVLTRPNNLNLIVEY